MKISINLSSDIPAYRQIANAIRPYLVNGCLRAGDRLPTSRQLALNLGIHFNTVAEAYRVLAKEGWLDLKRKRGVFVMERVTAGHHSQRDGANYLRRFRELVAEAQAMGISPRKIANELQVIVTELEKSS